MEHFGNVFNTIFYLIVTGNFDSTIRILSEVFVLLMCWVYRDKM